MITEKDLQEAISECLGQRNPTASTCLKLAAFYTIRNELYGGDPEAPPPAPSYSYAAPPESVETKINYYSDTDFGRLVDGRNPSEVWPLVDELVSEALQAVNPRLYEAFLRKLRQ